MSHNQPIHVLLVSGHDQMAEWLVSALRAETDIVLAGWMTSVERGAEMIGQRRIDVMLLDTSVPDVKQVERLQALAATPMGPALIVIAEPSEMAFVQQAIFAGVRGFLLRPFTQVQLIDSLHQTFSFVVQQRQAGALAGAAPPAESAETLVLFSPKGGVGRTSLAASLAMALHQETRRQVTLVDGDMQFGDVDIAVNAIARTSIADLFNYIDELDTLLVESALISHASGIRLLLAPPYFDPALAVDEQQLSRVIKTLALSQNGYVVVDAPSRLSEVTLSLFDVAQRVLLLTAASLASLRATKRFIELGDKLGFPPEKIVLVLSGYRKEADVPIEDIERHLNRPVAAVVPSDPLAMALALSQGQPIFLRDRNHAVSKAILKLARHLVGEVPGDMAQKTDAGVAVPAAEKRPATSAMLRLLKPTQALGS
jgi:pilus assembly protein CpaE